MTPYFTALHPATLILTWGLWVIVVQQLPTKYMAVCLVLLCLFAAYYSSSKLKQLFWRSRWIMISLLFVYGYSTPGRALVEPLTIWSPTYEGLLQGLIQLGRILFALAGLALLLDKLHRLALIAGLYYLFTPLKWLCLSPERLAIRLALTLHYAEVFMLRPQRNSLPNLIQLFETQNDVGPCPEHSLELPNPPVIWLDYLVVLSHLALLFWILL